MQKLIWMLNNWEVLEDWVSIGVCVLTFLHFCTLLAAPAYLFGQLFRQPCPRWLIVLGLLLAATASIAAMYALHGALNELYELLNTPLGPGLDTL